MVPPPPFSGSHDHRRYDLEFSIADILKPLTSICITFLTG